MRRILIVDDERQMRRFLQILLERLGLESSVAESGQEALALLDMQDFDLVLSDLRMRELDGLDLLRCLRERDPELPVVMLTAHGTIESAVEAMKLGAFDYILKPFDVEAIELVIQRALELRQYRNENRYLREQIEPAFGNLIGVSAAMQNVYELIRRVAPTRSAVLITGETGTGKELVARAIHEASPRSEKLFVPLNCAAVPSELLESELFGHSRGAFSGAQAERIGKFQVADGGTLFLDEIGDMAFPLQAKLLRVLEEGVVEPVGTNKRISVDVRLISSTNRDLVSAMQTGEFRDDLYYRLNVFHLDLPSLRDRLEDVEPLALFFVDRFARELGKPALRLSPEGIKVLQAYRWPGNVRELRNLMERAVVLSDGLQIDVELLHILLPGVPVEGDSSQAEDGNVQLEPAVARLERKLILRALGIANDNKAQAARLLAISERTLWYKLKKYNI